MTAGNTMERIVPDELTNGFGLASLGLHLERYRFAGKHLEGGRVLDIACGMGYGSHLLATESGTAVAEILGVDISAESIAYARNRYAHPKIRFIRQDALLFSDAAKFNAIITLETIEHLSDPAAFVATLYDLLLPGGILIASAPVTLSTDINPFHRSDFSEKSFRGLFSPYAFVGEDVLRQVQPVRWKEVLGKKTGSRTEGVRRHLPAYYLSHPGMFLSRVGAVLRHGLSNKYMVLALRKKA